jgi:hypothetical protein
MVEFRRSLDLSTSKDDMKKFYHIRAEIRELIREHLDSTLTWRGQSQDVKDAFEEAVCLSHVVCLIYY